MDKLTTGKNEKLLDDLLAPINDIQVRHKRARRTRVDVPADSLVAVLELLKGQASFVHLSAISCVDWLQAGQFELVYHCWSYEWQHLVSIHIRIDRKQAEYVSVYDLYKPAGFFERDIYEMYGIYFQGSPHMEKFILTEWEGMPPMRKDFDSEAYVNETFNWEDYHPQWLNELEQQGGGVVITPDDIRARETAHNPSRDNTESQKR